MGAHALYWKKILSTCWWISIVGKRKFLWWGHRKEFRKIMVGLTFDDPIDIALNELDSKANDVWDNIENICACK